MKLQEQLKRTTRGRRHNAKGRTIARPRFVQLFHWLQDTPAWRSLGPAPRALYIELSKRYNSFNNGEITMSVREAAVLVHISKNTATKCFHELEAKGFIRRNVCGSFDWKLKQATTWILTEFPLGETLATKDFASWTSKKENHGPNRRTNCPKRGIGMSGFEQLSPQSVLRLGPTAWLCTPSRSQSAARI